MFDRSDPFVATPTLPSGRRRLRADPRIPPTSLPDGRDVGRLVGGVYDAALGEDEWSSVLKRMLRLLGGESTALHPTPSPSARDGSVRVGCDPDFTPLYNDYYHRIMPLAPLVPRLRRARVFMGCAAMPEQAFLRSEFYNDYVRPQGKSSFMFWIDADDRGLRSHLSFWRSRRRSDWAEPELRVLAAVGPHLGRALEIQRRLAAAAPRGASAAPSGLLAPQERACLAGVARGFSSKQIARQLVLSMHTVNAYLASAKRKLKAASRSEAVAMALSAGLLDG
jgi:DNA-binding CsgD family transcriptional regulator